MCIYGSTNHLVKSGETLWSISRKYGIAYQQLLSSNPGIQPSQIKAGKRIRIPSRNSAHKNSQNNNSRSYIVQNGDTIYSLSRKFNIPVSEVRRLNSFSKGYHLKLGERVRLSKSSGNRYSRAVENNFHLNLSWPVKGSILERFGKKDQLFSGGIVIRSYGRQVKSASSGKVIFVGKVRGYGETIMIRHSSGVVTTYSTKDGVAKVNSGENISQGDLIVVRKQNENKLTLSFYVWHNDRFQNPLNYLK